MSKQIREMAREIQQDAEELAELATANDYSQEVFDQVESIKYDLLDLLEILEDDDRMEDLGWRRDPRL
jgi:hypothetical protein